MVLTSILYFTKWCIPTLFRAFYQKQIYHFLIITIKYSHVYFTDQIMTCKSTHFKFGLLRVFLYGTAKFLNVSARVQ